MKSCHVRQIVNNLGHQCLRTSSWWQYGSYWWEKGCEHV